MRTLIHILMLCLFYQTNVDNSAIVCTKTTIAQINPNLILTQFKLTNHSTEDYYTWVVFESTPDDSCIQDILKRYLFTRHGDFSLGNILTDNIVFINDFRSEIGVTFLKRLAPEETFSYYVWGNDNDVFEKHIFFIDETSFCKINGAVINTGALFQGSSIIIQPREVKNDSIVSDGKKRNTEKRCFF